MLLRGWIEPLATDSTLIMTAADATHTSYGCGRLSELTFFGRAVFHEQLRQTHSFTEAFAKAVPLIQQREVEAGKSDGFSNPQIRVARRSPRCCRPWSNGCRRWRPTPPTKSLPWQRTRQNRRWRRLRRPRPLPPPLRGPEGGP